MRYEDLLLKQPLESATYKEDSEFVITQVRKILDRQKETGDDKIIINQNLKMGLPLENINKIAGPMMEAWADEVFAGIRDNMDNDYHLINVEAQERLGMADIILQFRKGNTVLTGNVDVKATADDIPNSGNGWITWYYTQGVGKTKGFSPRHDDILYFTKNTKNFTFNLDDIRVPQKFYRSVNNMRGANPGNVWEFSHMHYCNTNRQRHPTQKPEGLYERMILASSNEGDTVLDPFLGSGTSLRVCQQLKRHGIGIDNNSEYIEMAKNRLLEPFVGFDSMDERMSRVPNDLNDPDIRITYLYNHIEWFLKNHKDAVPGFLEEVKSKYLVKMIETGQISIFDDYGIRI